MTLRPGRAGLGQSVGCGLVLSLTACVATTDFTKAPFRATTHLSEATTDGVAVVLRGTTQATKDLTAPMKELISQMAPGGDARVTKHLSVVAFAIMNYENLRVDMARGRGEYLDSFAALIGVPVDRYAGFLQTAQARYPWVYDDSLTPFESLDRLLVEYYDSSWQDVFVQSRL